uniref:Mothers against decapentaplegic homolog n=1 Tax=Photinus pyralis TaxID=7054 RepID=A0A1Y1KHV7_PHOPY
MFMFRKRRSSLTRRLEKARKRRSDETSRTFEEAAKGLLKKLNYDQLEILCTAVDSRGRDASNCVLLPPDNQPHVLCCRTWRWPEVHESGQLKRLPTCSSVTDPVYICCNPYHWSRICLPDSPPPPYTRFAMERLKPEDRAPSEVPLVCRDTFPGSLTTDGEDSLMNPREWCKLAYWEMAQRVGPLYPVEMPSVNVFGDIPFGDGLCLKTLALHSFSPPDPVCRTRCKIGLGVTLSREDDGIWVYNRSENPVFVNSLTLEDPESPSPTKVPAEHCLCVFDPIKAAYQNFGWSFTNCYGPVDPNSVRISFVKGWGRHYSRQEITSCPCWLEILLAPCR